MVVAADETESENPGPLPRKLSGPLAMRRSSAGEAEDSFDESAMLNRFAAQSRGGPMRRQSYAGYRTAPPVELLGGMRQRGRRMSEGSMLPRLSLASKRDRDMRKVCDEMEVGSRKAEEEITTFKHDLESLGSTCINMTKRIDRLIEASNDLRNSHRHILTGRYNTDGEYGMYGRGQYQGSRRGSVKRKTSQQQSAF
ncbi:uncharacterized protein LOC116619922 [Nematostella vectensis]|uniref:uncharacterized protein LOC116619922 n=1 Tax=Nematostella vectensis TaxID=45351 RepID=UPI00207778F1|nr:uncharacterized protein LOC116619922 [Nematostella vectensis]